MAAAGWPDLMTSSSPSPIPEEPSNAELLEQLRQDRLWLLRQLDAGHWTPWRLDLAALERELGQMLELVGDRLG